MLTIARQNLLLDIRKKYLNKLQTFYQFNPCQSPDSSRKTFYIFQLMNFGQKLHYKQLSETLSNGKFGLGILGN